MVHAASGQGALSIPADVVDADDKAAFIAEATRLVLEAAAQAGVSG